jgi:hypothetical protein
LGSHVGLGGAFRAEDQDLIASRDQMLHRLGEPGDDAVHLGQKGFGEKGDLQGFGVVP